MGPKGMRMHIGTNAKLSGIGANLGEGLAGGVGSGLLTLYG